MTRLLVVTAVTAERDAVLGERTAAGGTRAGIEVLRSLTGAGLLDVAAVGVGPVAAALGTAALLDGGGYDLVLAAGIGGGFPGSEVGTVVVADAVVQADLGAETADGGFSSLAELGWGAVRQPAEPWLAARLADLLGARSGAVLSVSTVTGTQRRADRLLATHPDAVAEGMEGAGACQAAARYGVAFGELRAISNLVGPRRRESWQIPRALAELARAFDRLLARPLTEPTTTGASR